MCQASPGRFLGYLPAYLNDRINPPNSSNAVEGQGRDMSVRGKRRKKRGGKGGKKSGSESGGELVSEGPLMAHFGKYLFSLATNFLHAPSQRVQWLVAAGVRASGWDACCLCHNAVLATSCVSRSHSSPCTCPPSLLASHN